MLGKFYGVSVGPGAPDLLTLRAHRILTEVPVVAYPACKPGASSYAWRIVEEFVDAEAQEPLPLVFPMSKDWAALVPHWTACADEIATRLEAGRDVAFITEGDATLFSTFLHVFEVLRRRLPEAEVEIVPGVTSLTAAAALAGRALGQGDERLAVIPATWRADELRATLAEFDCVILMKAARVIPQIIDTLSELGRLDEAVLVSRGTAEREIVSGDLERYRSAKLPYLTTVLVAPAGSFLERLEARAARAQESAS